MRKIYRGEYYIASGQRSAAYTWLFTLRLAAIAIQITNVYSFGSARWRSLFFTILLFIKYLQDVIRYTSPVEQLKQEGYPVDEHDLAHVWPTRYAHSNVHGKYHFNVEEWPV